MQDVHFQWPPWSSLGPRHQAQTRGADALSRAAPETAGRPAGSGAKPREGEKGRHAGPNLTLLKNPRANSQGEAERMRVLP